jgi:hypothetical protein
MASTVLSFVAVCSSASSTSDPPAEWVEAIERGDRVWGDNYSTVGGNMQVSGCHAATPCSDAVARRGSVEWPDRDKCASVQRPGKAKRATSVQWPD